MSENAKWYVIHTYSGYENAVKTSIEKFVNGRGMEDMILRMEIPVETVKEVSESGEAKEVERKVFPGYVLIKMVMTDDTWHLVRNVRGVTGFVGTANKPIPLTEEEVLAMGMKSTRSSWATTSATMFVRGWPLGQLHWRCGRHRTRKESGQRHGFHVRSRDPRGTGAGSGGSPELIFPAGIPGKQWEGPSAPPKTDIVRHHIYDLGGATPWHRRLLVM